MNTKENKIREHLKRLRTNITIVIIAVLFIAMVSVATVSATPNLPTLPAQNAIKQAIADGNFSIDDIEGNPEYSIKILEQNETHIKFKANTRIIFKNPKGAGYDNNRWPSFKINKTEGNIKAGNYDQQIKDSILYDIKKIKDKDERSKKLKEWNRYNFENGSRIYEVSEVYEATYPNESDLKSALSRILPGDTKVYNNYVLMGFTNNVHWTYSRQENLYVKIIFWKVLIAWARVDAILDATLGLRLPTIVGLNMPSTMVRGQSYTLNTNINGQDWDAAQYSVANVPSENGNEFIARGQASLTIQAWARIIGNIGPYYLYNKGFDYSRSFQTPFGPYQEFPIPDLYLSPDQTGLKVYCCANLLWGGIGLKIDPNLGSDKITASWNVGGDAIGSGSTEYNMPNTNYYFGPVLANDYSPTTDYANIRLSDYKYYFTICGLTLGANLQGGLTFLPLTIQTGYIDFYTYNCGDITEGHYLGIYQGTTADSVNGEDLVIPENINLFVNGSDNALYYNKYDNTSWSGWQGLGGYITSNPDVISSGPDLYVFVRGSDNALYYKKYNSTSWSGWQDLGGNVTSDSDEAKLGSNLYVFIRGTDNALYYNKYDNTSWSGWQGLGGNVTSDSDEAKLGSNLYLFARGSDNALYYNKYDNTSWSGWQNLGGYITSNPDVISSGPDLYVFVRGSDNALYYKKYNSTSWSGWKGLGGNVTSDSDEAKLGSNLYVFVRGTDNALYYNKYDNTSWSGWQGLGGYITSKSDETISGYNLNVFVRGRDNAIYYNKYDGASWSGWQSLGGYAISKPDTTS